MAAFGGGAQRPGPPPARAGARPGGSQAAHEARALLRRGGKFSEATAAVYLTIVWCLRETRRYREAIAVAEEGLARMPDAVLAQWATQIEEELIAAEKEEC